MDINKLMKLAKAASRDVKQTKDGLKASTASSKEINNILEKTPINYNEYKGLALNPNLSSTQIRIMYNKLKEDNDREKGDKSIPAATLTKNMNSRSQIRVILAQHPNLDPEDIKKLLISSKLSKSGVFQNPNIKEEHLNYYFGNAVMTSIGSYKYSFIAFNRLMNAKNINEKLVESWYNTLKKYADWTYSDNQWYSIVSDFLKSPFCPVELLEKVAGLPIGKAFSHLELHREQVYNHEKTTNEIQNIIFTVTKNEKFLPQTAKDVFLF